MITPPEKTVIEDWRHNFDGKANIRLQLTKDERSQAFEAFIQLLSADSDKIAVARCTVAEEKPPEIGIGEAVKYLAIPQGPELIPFLELLSAFSAPPPVLPEPLAQLLNRVNMPTQLKLYISPQCPFCPQAVRSLFPLSLVNPLVRLMIIDGSMFSELAAADNIRSAPTLLLNSTCQWSGAFNIQEIVEMLVSSDPSRLSASTLEDMIKDGQAGKLSELMLEKGMILPAFPDLLVHPYFSTRLGAMTVMEELSERDPALARQIVTPLMEKYPMQSVSVKGDIVFVLGLSADRTILSDLQRIMSQAETPEIQEAAQEAIAAITERCVEITTKN